MIDGFKLVVKDNMILQTDEASVKIPHHGHKSWMFSWKNKELAHASSSAPLGKLMFILEFRVENINRAFPDMGSEDVTMVRLDGWHKLQRGYPTFSLWDSIVEPCRMVHCEQPKTQIVCAVVTLIECSVNYELTRHVHNCLNGTLCLSILMLSPNSTKTLSLCKTSIDVS